MSPSKTTRRCAVYARISVTKDESVSLARQVESAELYAAARGWAVAAVFRDDGVSASKNKPEDRAGWRALLESPESFDTVIVWKVDRLARRVLDFLHADEALQARGAGIVAVEDPVDMTTPQGRGFATMLAVFGELETAAISARVKAARTHLLNDGRVVGGKVPYGWRSIANPNGKGKVLAHDPERIGTVREIVKRARCGDTLYSIKQWLKAEGTPSPTGNGSWPYSTVERVLRHPVLAGLTPFNPGNDGRTRGADVLRGEDGLPKVDEAVALMSVGEWRALVTALDDRESVQSAPRASRNSTSPLLSGLVRCGDCDARMYRGTTQKRPGYSCPSCSQTITNFEDIVIEQVLWAKGEHVRWSVVREVAEGGAAVLPEIEHRLDELADLIRRAPDRETRQRLQAEQGNLLDLRDEKQGQAPTVEYRWAPGTATFGEDWAAAESADDRRAVLDDALAGIVVHRGRPGRRTREQVLARLTFDWKMPEQLGPLPEPDETWVA